MSKESWTRMFRSIGLNDADMRQWHAHFERTMPEAHRDFLESLGLDASEVRRLRAWSGAKRSLDLSVPIRNQDGRVARGEPGKVRRHIDE